MTIYYAAVVYNRQILCSYTTGGSQYEAAVEYVVPQVDTSRVGDKLAYGTHDGLAVHFLVAERGVLFTCVTPADFNRQRSHACLEALLKNFESANLFSRVVEAGPYGLRSQFSLALQVQVEKYSKPESAIPGQNMLTDIQAKVEEVKVVMVRNVQKIIDRGERLDDLNERAESLEMRSDQFRITATRVRKKMWWENMKMKLILSGAAILILFIIIMAILGSTGVFTIGGSDSSSSSQSSSQQQQQQITKSLFTTITSSSTLTPPSTQRSQG